MSLFVLIWEVLNEVGVDGVGVISFLGGSACLPVCFFPFHKIQCFQHISR